MIPAIPEGMITTDQAKDILGLVKSRVQQLCRLYISSGGQSGIECIKIGNGSHAIFLVSRKDCEEYKSREIKRGWKKGNKRNVSSILTMDDTLK